MELNIIRKAMAHKTISLHVLLTVFLVTNYSAITGAAETGKTSLLPDRSVITLPAPVYQGRMSVEEALKKRESVRQFSQSPLTEQELAQLLWAAQGKTRDWAARTAPSAGALFPLEVYVVIREGVFRYSSGDHRILRVVKTDVRRQLAAAALGQDIIRQAPAVFVIAGVYKRTAEKYSNRAKRYVEIEAGHAGQNLLLQAVSLGLGAVPVGAFQDAHVKQTLHLPVNHEPLYLIPVGRKRFVPP
ncbi:MAG TPA: SagB/ThcOx family dehydrogenase [Smithella sp.]|nr:SagB/ThcOx family dehydrogenase [Smithella sp.]